jgi:hypothetical protein
VYRWQQELSGVNVEKVQATNLASLELGIEGSDHVVYFTHDYNAQTSDKNDFLVKTAGKDSSFKAIAKRQGVEKLLMVTPIENDLFYNEDEVLLSTIRKDSTQAAL